ncbi:cell division protein FtsZ [Sneathiella sp.]|uniref:cell division protein FtsZ n=1 Tax=Sneathiella sp. TaxID=1964365 RepID=UPI002633EE5C|nr:cell division protein FtsZ [Sneathiella sp.]MDF2367776.1 cell division protein FtsZ [Sneathiella sp.]
MSINLSVPEQSELKPKILVLGVGGAGGNAVNNMISSELQGVEFVVANTDAQALKQSLAERRIQLGAELTEGLGAGSKPHVGAGAAEEALDEIIGHLEGVHMCFITAGMGGGTGTGAAPVVARAAREKGILTVGVVTKPFQFEGSHRMRIAEAGIEELQRYVDTLIIIPNQNLFRIANEKTTFADAFNMADEVLHSGVRGVTDLMVMPGLINLDFADVNTVMNEMGKAMMGTGEASGENRAIEAAEAAISNPLLDDVSMKGARGVLINITGGMDLTLYELDEAANRIRSEVDPEANIIVGSTFDTEMEGSMRVSVVATGIDALEAQKANSPNVTSLRSLKGEGKAPSLSTSGTSDGAPMVPAAADISASGFGATVPGGNFSGQPVAHAGDATSGSENLEMGSTSTDAGYMSGNLAVDQERDLLSDIDGEMEESEQSFSEAEGKDSPFSAPPAIKVDKSPEKLVNPDAYEALVDAADPKSKKRGPSLFERMTGVSRNFRKETAREEAPAPVRKEPTSTRVASTPAAPAPAVAQNPTVRKEVTSSVKIEQKQEDEDLLDIPAFLRRQAN